MLIWRLEITMFYIAACCTRHIVPICTVPVEVKHAKNHKEIIFKGQELHRRKGRYLSVEASILIKPCYQVMILVLLLCQHGLVNYKTMLNYWYLYWVLGRHKFKNAFAIMVCICFLLWPRTSDNFKDSSECILSTLHV